MKTNFLSVSVRSSHTLPHNNTSKLAEGKGREKTLELLQFNIF